MIVLTHPELGRTHQVRNATTAAVYRRSGWVVHEAPEVGADTEPATAGDTPDMEEH